MAVRSIVLAIAGALALASCSKPAEKLGPGDWGAHNGNAAETAFSPLEEINTGNIAKLGLAFSLDLPGEVTLEATPVAVGGTLYFTGSHAQVYAVDGSTGKLLWKHDPQTWKVNPWMLKQNFAANRGVAYANGRVFAATLDGRLIALDAKTGKLEWSVQTVNPKSHQYVTGAPRTFGDKVIIGQGGADFGERGFVTAFQQDSGAMMWQFFVTPGEPTQNAGDPAMEKAAKTWNGEFWKTGTGGGPWDGITFDEELNRIYVGTGNAAPIDPNTRGNERGDNLYTAGIVALDAETGKYVWHYQENPRDSWDYDSTQQMTATTLTIAGKKRQVLMHAPKNGFLYVLDRTDGRVISAEKIVKATWADHIDLTTGRPVEEKDIRFEKGDVTIWPNPAGAHSWQAQSFSPKTGLLYIPVTQNGVHFGKGHSVEGGFDVGGLSIATEKRDERDGKGSLLAWNPVTQKQAWIVKHDTMYNGGAMATAGGLVFQGIADGWFSAYDAGAGSKLWSFDAGLGIIAAPMSYLAGGKQYVALLVGWGGSASAGSDVMNVGWKWGQNPRRLLVFALDGKAAIPAGPKATMKVDAQDDPALVINPNAAKIGHELFLACAVCHGRHARSAGAPGPDLRESALSLDKEAFVQVVTQGPLLEQGMPRFEELTRDQVENIWMFVRQEARAAKRAGGKNPGV